ncbi:sugar phosphate nucleotidyltransferase [Sphaerisporangium rhizosphaerae]|uniref:Sugar phosphate nucleotidyltransferase n=1 Tax=Sphaerisporangium rhizosphaerae TaxID=2269375 RepID=A0ABW2PDU2_9ACTN
MSAFPGTAPPPVVLLCGGLGLRQRADDDDVPKPLRPLPDGRALLLHVLDYYRAFGLTDFVLCVGYGAEAVEDLLLHEFRVRSHDVRAGAGWHRFEAGGTRVTLVDGGPWAGKCLRLLQAREHIGDGPFLLGYGDVLSDFDLGALARRHRAAGGLLTLTATRVRSRYGELSVDATMAVTGFEEKPLQPALISAGYFMCAPGLFDVLSPDIDLEQQVIPLLVARGAVHAVLHDGLWLPFDTYKDFIDVETLIHQKGCPWLQPI